MYTIWKRNLDTENKLLPVSNNSKSNITVYIYRPKCSGIFTIHMHVEHLTCIHTLYEPQWHIYKGIPQPDEQSEVRQGDDAIFSPTQVLHTLPW